MSREFLIFYVTALAMSATDDAAMIVFVLRIREHFIQPALIAAAPQGRCACCHQSVAKLQTGNNPAGRLRQIESHIAVFARQAPVVLCIITQLLVDLERC
ncbi:hypothetical protein [Thalassolituus hydrocarboniclasticus]|uniref:Secreted protein n=1 Tax=Thalassolituus hydrocarboniclasticus TaxID=2742796 RepID=A0ABY6ADK9_9GAMM|nr:hypothetical protein [Thalassolituus hydrocarboniclasticus]UXD88059.1 hypothetical protein HUF19_11735 [Thalassolituus hydrocarboniclasticus]